MVIESDLHFAFHNPNFQYSRVPNKHGATFINFRNFVQGVHSYLGVVKYLLRGYVYSFWPKMSWGYDY